jgi:hypothetical protein
VNATTSWAASSVPYLLQLAVMVAGLVVSIVTRRRGRGTVLLVTAFAVMIAVTIGWLVWMRVLLDAPQLTHDYHLDVDVWQYLSIGIGDTLGVLEVAAWLMVLLAVLRARPRVSPPVG